jgi:hypothetical protein
VNEPQYDDQGAPAHDVPEDQAPVDPDREDPAADEAAPEQSSTEMPLEGAAHPDLSAAAPSRVEHTGNPVVDSVLDSLEELDRLPPSEHVAVFEAAHERLRGALSDAGDPPSDA